MAKQWTLHNIENIPQLVVCRQQIGPPHPAVICSSKFGNTNNTKTLRHFTPAFCCCTHTQRQSVWLLHLPHHKFTSLHISHVSTNQPSILPSTLAADPPPSTTYTHPIPGKVKLRSSRSHRIPRPAQVIEGFFSGRGGRGRGCARVLCQLPERTFAE